MGIFSRKADGDIRHRAVDGAENENNTIRISWLFLRKSWLCYRGILVIAQILVILPRNLGYCFAGTIRFSIPVYRPARRRKSSLKFSVPFGVRGRGHSASGD